MIFVVVLCYVLHSGEIAHKEYVDIIIMIMSITSQKLVYFQQLYKHPIIHTNNCTFKEPPKHKETASRLFILKYTLLFIGSR